MRAVYDLWLWLCVCMCAWVGRGWCVRCVWVCRVEVMRDCECGVCVVRSGGCNGGMYVCNIICVSTYVCVCVCLCVYVWRCVCGWVVCKTILKHN